MLKNHEVDCVAREMVRGLVEEFNRNQIMSGLGSVWSSSFTLNVLEANEK